MKQTTIFQALGDETRLRALLLIADAGELCVCELVQALEIPQPKISRHMAMMREAGLVAARRHAQWVYYAINPDLEPWQRKIIDAAVSGAADDPIARKDRRRLSTNKVRPVQCSTG